jgi:hypothetical protein
MIPGEKSDLRFAVLCFVALSLSLHSWGKVPGMLDDFASKKWRSPMGGKWRAVSDASFGGSSESRLVWVKKLPAKNKKVAKLGPQEGMLRLEFELKPNPQVRRPDAGVVLGLVEPADWRGVSEIEIWGQLSVERGKCLSMLVAEVMDGASQMWKPVAVPLSLVAGASPLRLKVPLAKMRTMKHWAKRNLVHDKRTDWLQVRSLQLVVLSKGHCKGRLTVDRIKLISEKED